jgi:hypothetical protein
MPSRTKDAHIAIWPYAFAGVVLLVVLATTLLLMGREPWCTCGYVRLWHGEVMSSENSQHLIDWYSFTHIVHGFGLYGILWLVGRRWPMGLRLLLAVAVEVVWEIVENTDFVIERYREMTIALDYYGDSVVNSIGDVLFCVAGLLLAARLPVWATITLALALELALAYVIRDNLALNIIMLIYPFEAIKAWQSGA